MMKLDKKRLKELSYEIREFIENSFKCEKDDDESIKAFEKELKYFLDEWLDPAIELTIDDYLDYKEQDNA